MERQRLSELILRAIRPISNGILLQPAERKPSPENISLSSWGTLSERTQVLSIPKCPKDLRNSSFSRPSKGGGRSDIDDSIGTIGYWMIGYSEWSLNRSKWSSKNYNGHYDYGHWSYQSLASTSSTPVPPKMSSYDHCSLRTRRSGKSLKSLKVSSNSP